MPWSRVRSSSGEGRWATNFSRHWVPPLALKKTKPRSERSGCRWWRFLIGSIGTWIDVFSIVEGFARFAWRLTSNSFAYTIWVKSFHFYLLELINYQGFDLLFRQISSFTILAIKPLYLISLISLFVAPQSKHQNLISTSLSKFYLPYMSLCMDVSTNVFPFIKDYKNEIIC